MGIIFYGLMFLAMDLILPLKSDVWEMKIGLMPDILGFILLAIGLKKLKTNSVYFSRAISVCIGMVLPSALYFGMGLMGQKGLVMALLALLCVIGTIVVGFLVIAGLRDMECNDDVDVHATTLRTFWLSYTAIRALAFLVSIVLLFGYFSLLGAIASYATDIIGLTFMVLFYRTKNKFEEIYVFE